MTSKFTKLLSLLLCAVLVLGMLPPVAASAAETETSNQDGWKYVEKKEIEVEIPVVEEKKEAPVVDAPTQGEHGVWQIESFADLKEMLSKTLPEGQNWLSISYIGTEPLVITEDITIPANYSIYVNGTLQIPQGVTMTIEESGYLDADVLQIDGTLKMESYTRIYVSNKLVVNGTFRAADIDVELETKVEGFDKIQWIESFYHMTIRSFAEGVEDFYKKLADITPRLNDRLKAYLNMWTYENAVLDKSFTIPKGMSVTFDSMYTYTIDSGCTVTMEEETSVSCNAKLILKGTVNIAKGSYLNIGEAYGHLEFAGGKVTGKGYVQVWNYGTDPASFFTGLDTTKYELVSGGGADWQLRNIEGLTKAANPATPKWGIRYDFKWNAAENKIDITEIAAPTSVAFKGMDGVESLEILVYYEGEYGPEEVFWYNTYAREGEVFSIDIFQNAEMQSGTYYVTVQAIGDYETVRSSNVVTSEKYTYTNPGKKLEKVTNVKAENNVVSWDPHSQADKVDYYQVEIWWAPDANSEPQNRVWSLSTETTSLIVPERIKTMIGEGYYYFNVMAASNDASKITSSEYTMSGAMKVEFAETTRYAGKDRFDTAFMVADALKDYDGVEKFNHIIVASGSNFADALAGSYLASWYGAPILLSYKDKQNNQAKEYIKANLAENGVVYILGGESAVPKSMEVGLEAYKIVRLAGANRFLTNLEILKEAEMLEGAPILVATGSNFADCLSASATGLPILLVHKNLTKEQKDFLAKDADPKKNPVFILGGESAVNATVEAELKALGFEVERMAGANRFETSVMLAEKFSYNPSSAVLAYAANYPDGLCGGVLAFAMGAPLILTMDKYESVAAEYAKKTGIERAVTLGGTGLISDGAVNTILGK